MIASNERMGSLTGVPPKSSKRQKAARVTPCAPSLPQENTGFCDVDSGCDPYGVTRPATGEDALASAVTRETGDWLLWQLADSAFPTGGFAHSAGLEAAWQHGAVRKRDELAAFLDASLGQLGHSTLPFVTAAHGEPERLEEFDRLCDAFTTNHVANRASRTQGRALLAAVERIFPGRRFLTEREGNSGTERAGSETGAPNHFAPVFGSCLRRLAVPRETAQRMFFFQHLRSLLAAAVRLNIVGPMEAQTLQHRLGPRVGEILARCRSLTLADLAQTAPLLDLWQAAHDRLYSRLFQS